MKTEPRHQSQRLRRGSLETFGREMNPDYILLTGVKNPKRLEDYFASNLVDVAYAEALSSGRVKILVEPDTDLRNEEDVSWILELVVDALRKNEEDGVSTEIVLAA
jgi:hypothetical protein